MINRDEYLKALEIVKEYQKQCYDELEKIKEVITIDELKDQDLRDHISMHIYNILLVNRQIGFTDENWFTHKPKVSDLCNVSEKELFAKPGMGVIRRVTIKDLCLRANIKMLP